MSRTYYATTTEGKRKITTKKINYYPRREAI